jgi:hypothetical protein
MAVLLACPKSDVFLAELAWPLNDVTFLIYIGKNEPISQQTLNKACIDQMIRSYIVPMLIHSWLLQWLSGARRPPYVVLEII